jgi:hypothetical protein
VLPKDEKLFCSQRYTLRHQLTGHVDCSHIYQERDANKAFQDYHADGGERASFNTISYLENLTLISLIEHEWMQRDLVSAVSQPSCQ